MSPLLQCKNALYNVLNKGLSERLPAWESPVLPWPVRASIRLGLCHFMGSALSLFIDLSFLHLEGLMTLGPLPIGDS